MGYIFKLTKIFYFKFKVGMFALKTAVYFQLDPQMMELLTVSSLMFVN